MPPMRLSNNPDIALAQEWLGELEHWFQTHGVVGYDPFDVKQHPLIQRVQPYPLLRKASTAACDFFPKSSRCVLGIEKAENPKTHALLALAKLRLFQLMEDEAYLEAATEHLDCLRALAIPNLKGMSWGYPFRVFAQGLDSPKDTPNIILATIAGQAFFLAYTLSQKEEYAEAAASIARFILEELPRMAGPEGQHCFAYTPTDMRRVHNANLLGVEHLLRTKALTGEEAFQEAALPALAYSLACQREDGAWRYGEYVQGDPYEAQLLALIDHHHTGFVLRSLHAIHQVQEETAVKEAMKRGYRFYKKLFTPAGMPIHDYGAYPVDIHACAEGILCPSVLSDSVLGGQRVSLGTMRWTWANLRDPKTGAPWHRKYPYFTSRMVYPRWNVAWLYRALAEYLFQFYTDRDTVDRPGM